MYEMRLYLKRYSTAKNQDQFENIYYERYIV